MSGIPSPIKKRLLILIIMLLTSIKIVSINYDRYSQIKKIDSTKPHSNVTPKKHPLHTLKHKLLTQKPALEITQSANIIKMITKDTQTELPLILHHLKTNSKRISTLNLNTQLNTLEIHFE